MNSQDDNRHENLSEIDYKSDDTVLLQLDDMIFIPPRESKTIMTPNNIVSSENSLFLITLNFFNIN